MIALCTKFIGYRIVPKLAKLNFRTLWNPPPRKRRRLRVARRARLTRVRCQNLAPRGGLKFGTPRYTDLQIDLKVYSFYKDTHNIIQINGVI